MQRTRGTLFSQQVTTPDWQWGHTAQSQGKPSRLGTAAQPCLSLSFRTKQCWPYQDTDTFTPRALPCSPGHPRLDAPYGIPHSSTAANRGPASIAGSNRAQESASQSAALASGAALTSASCQGPAAGTPSSWEVGLLRSCLCGADVPSISRKKCV